MKGISKILVLSIIGIIERFSFYAIIGILFLFMTSSEVGFSVDDSRKLYGFFMSCIYFLPILFGLLADLTNRKIMIVIGLGIAIIGYLLIYWLSGHISGLYIGLGITAIGLSAYKPNIHVILGDTAFNSNQNKLVLQGFILFGLIGSVGGFFSGFLSSYIRIEYGYKILFITASLALIPAILLYYFAVYKSHKEVQGYQVQKKQGLILVLILIISFFIAYGSLIVNKSIYGLIDFETVEDVYDDPYYFDAVMQMVRELIIIFIGLLGFGILFTKLIKVNYKTLISIFSIGICLMIAFLVYSNYNLINISYKSNRLFVTFVLVISVLDILIFPLIRYFIYMYSYRFKGLAFGIFFAQFAVISKYLIKDDLVDNTLIYISICLLVLLIGLIIISRRNTTLPNRL